MISYINDARGRHRIRGITIPVILAAIIGFSILASITLYSIQTANFSKIVKEENDKLKVDLSERSFYVTQLAGEHLRGVQKVTEILSHAKSFQLGEVDRIRLLLDAAQLDSSEIVDSFFVLDKEGTLLDTTNIDPTAVKNIGKNFQTHVTYTVTKETGKPYISPLILGSDNSSRFFIASPIIDQGTGDFRGVVSASIRADTFAKSIEKLAISKSDDFKSISLSLIDPDGAIMYAGPSAKNLGKNVLSDEVLSSIPSGIKEGLVASLKEAVSGRTGVYVLNLAEHPELNTSSDNNNGTSGSSSSTASSSIPFDYVLISYAPVLVDDQIVMISFVITAVSVKTILDQNEVLTGSYMFVIIYAMLGIMTVFAILIMVINRRLSRTVDARTNELEESNNRLKKAASEIAEQADKLAEADVKKAEFSAMITHELKTPLVSIIGYGSMLLNGKLGELSSIQRQKFQIMYKNAERLSELIQDILDVQKLELGVFQLDIRQTSAKDMIEQSISSLKPQADSKSVRLSSQLNEDLILQCDSSRIIQVLNNLVSNGIKFSANNSTIEIDAKLEDHSIVFNVKDSGIGIPKEKQTKLFTKFYQVDTSLTRKSGGTGLGLVICKGIVEAHKGKLWLDSEAGKGSIFSFSIPVGGKVGEKDSSGS